MRKIMLMFFAFLLTLPVVAQKSRKDRKEERRARINALIHQEEEGVIAYHKHTVYGVKLITDGYGAFMEIGRASSVKKALLFQLEIAEHKHPKEEKQTSSIASTTPFVFGKHNYFYNVKLGVQQQFLFGNKGNRNGVSVTGNIGGGISLGLLRPYYVQVYSDSTDGTKFVKYDSPDSLEFINGLIIGGPSFGQGWSEMKFTPGLYAKAAVRFDYGRYNEMVSAIEIGLTGEFYTKKIPQIVYAKEKQFFLNAYVSIVLGKRK